MLKKTGSSFLPHASYLAKAKSGPIGHSEFPDYLSVSYGYAKKKKKRKRKKMKSLPGFPLSIDVNGILNYRASYFVKRRMRKTIGLPAEH